jgi:hypothetical protein
MADQIIPPGRREQFFDSNGDPTLRFIRWMEDISNANNDNTNVIDVATSVQSFSSQTQWIQQQLNGLPEFTIDTTGFTADTTFITTDKVIA